MTIKIEIEAHPDRGDMGQQVERAMAALGYARSVSSVSHEAKMARHVEAAREGVAAFREAVTAPQTATEAAGEDAPTQTVSQIAETEQAEAPAPVLDTRPVGSPSEGNKRRNSAEKAEDDTFEAVAAARGVTLEKLNEAIAKHGRDKVQEELHDMPKADKQIAEEPQAAISTGEERIGPDDAQDAADEAAETAKTGLAPIDVLRRLVGDYQKKHGMPKAVALCQEGGLIGKPIHDLDDAGIEAAIAAMQGGAEPKAEPAEEPAKAEEPAPLEPKTKADLIEAMMRYGDKFDGTREQAKMVNTLADCPRIFADLFGADVTQVSKVPADGYARAVAAIDEAIATDPFGRAK
jgi:hypothetical protein